MTHDIAAEIISDSNRRVSPREAVDDEALTFMNEDSISCVVRDISETGARLKIPLGTFVPPRFKLWIVEKQLLAECDTVWRKRNEVGVKFSSVVAMG